jgi:two-component system LytT family response regulator
MRVIIVDDEALARGLVRELLAKHADIEIVAECANGFDAVQAIADLAPDLVFLDIQMPKLNGFDVVELAGAKARYIFVTAFDQYALKAFDVHAVDYLLKPFSQQRLDAALAHARASGAGGAPQALTHAPGVRPKPLERVLIRAGARVHIVAAGQIDYVEAQDDYVRISAAGKDYLKNQRLSELESELDPSVFVRVHRSWMLNLGAILRIEQGRDSHTAILKEGSRIPVSRSGYQKLKALLG